MLVIKLTDEILLHFQRFLKVAMHDLSRAEQPYNQLWCSDFNLLLISSLIGASMQIEASDWLSGKKLTGREAINDLSKADRPISLMEPLITDRQAQVTDQG